MQQPVATIPLTQGKVAVVDDADVEELSRYRWHAVNYHGYWYARSREGLMHRILMGLARHNRLVVDHINGDGLDNRRENMRVCKPGHNARNQRKRRSSTSPYKGVHYRADIGLWEARVGWNGKRYSAGMHETAEGARDAYNWLASRLHGAYHRPS